MPTDTPSPPAPLPPPPAQPIVSGKQLALTVYILYLASFFVGITVVIGLVIAYVKIDGADPLLRSHYQFQIRTFWIGLLYLVVGAGLCLIVIGIAVLVWWFIWTLVRCVKGILALNENRPIANPTSWMFG
jgi:uncharacterized membrane protein